jgi:DNA-binding NtrC family response regulator
VTSDRAEDPESPDETRTGASELSDTQPSEEGGQQLSVLVISERNVGTRTLPSMGDVRIGRGNQADLVIDDPSISRTHALLSIGATLTLRDLGSANGTRLGDRQLRTDEVVAVQPGEVIQLGAVTLIIQRRAPTVRVQRLWAHDYFEVRVEEECVRAARVGGSFALARLHCRPVPPPEALQAALVAACEATTVVGEYGPGEFELLLVDTSPEAAAIAIERLAERLRRGGGTIQRGVACYPRDGRHADVLLQRASPFPRAASAEPDPAVGAAIIADRRMQDLYGLAERIAAGNITVLILGETGVGKEVLAERLHRMSPRAPRPYLKLNCAALSESLLESELFGHERGAFTGAVTAKEGLLETADGGTIFLDEIGELPPSTQVKLLRVLEERVVMRVGGLKGRPLDVRFIAATNRDLEAEIARGVFRQDLFFRLNGATLVVPPLRERVSEIAELGRAFVAQAARQMNHARPPSISRAAYDLMLGYSWPGNIRELRNVMERAVLLCTAGEILPSHLPLEKMRGTLGVSTELDRAALMAAQAQAGGAPAVSTSSSEITLATGRSRRRSNTVATATVRLPGPADAPPAASEREREKQRILEALATCAGNQTAAAAHLGIARRTLINKLELHGISRPRKR